MNLIIAQNVLLGCIVCSLVGIIYFIRIAIFRIDLCNLFSDRIEVDCADAMLRRAYTAGADFCGTEEGWLAFVHNEYEYKEGTGDNERSHASNRCNKRVIYFCTRQHGHGGPCAMDVRHVGMEADYDIQ